MEVFATLPQVYGVTKSLMSLPIHCESLFATSFPCKTAGAHYTGFGHTLAQDLVLKNAAEGFGQCIDVLRVKAFASITHEFRERGAIGNDHKCAKILLA